MGAAGTLLREVEMAGIWPTNASTILIFLTPKEHHFRATYRVVANLDTMVGVATGSGFRGVEG